MIDIRRANLYCCEDISNIENYEMAINSCELWHCHHKKGENLSKEELIDLDLYFNRPSNELIFLTSHEHLTLHSIGRVQASGWHHSEEWKNKMSIRMSGENNPMYGKNAYEGKSYEEMAEISIKKSMATKGKTPTPEAVLNRKNALKGRVSSIKGKHWYTNGYINICDFECPEGFYPGRKPKIM